MKIILTGQQNSQFQEEGRVLFQGAVPPKRIEALLSALPEKELSFLGGRDLWRREEEAARFARQPLFKELAALFHEGPLLLAADQLFGSEVKSFYESSATGEELFSIRGTQLLFLVRLKGGEPAELGDLLLVNGQVELPIHEMEGLFYLLSYADPKALYVQGERDPLKNHLKGLGYVIGDRLSAHGHPFVLR